MVIVIAILAILVGLLAPQYTKYVEKSRKTADASNMDEMVKVVKVYAADPANELPAGIYKIVISHDKSTPTDITAEAVDATIGKPSDEAVNAFYKLTRIEGIIPALESSHAVAYAMKIAPTLSKDSIILVNLSGRGDKDMDIIESYENKEEAINE